MKEYGLRYILIFIVSLIISFGTKNAYAGGPCCGAGNGNDNFASAISLTVGAAATAGCTFGATTQAGENTGCMTATESVWYSFVATATTQYVTSVWTGAGGAGCYGGSAVWNTASLPTTACGQMLSCQSASYGPLTQIHQLTGLTVGATYYIQILYDPGGPCGSPYCFTIQVTTTTAGTITNPAPISTCSSPEGCLAQFDHNPTVAEVTAAGCCYSNPAQANGQNEVYQGCFTFTNLYNTSINIQNIISSNCGGGNVIWIEWTLYPSSNCSAPLDCGDLSDMVASGLTIGTNYTLCYAYEIPPCTHTQLCPYMWAIPLPVELLYFNAVCKDNVVIAEWETASEKNNDYFTLEKSKDGTLFHLVKKIKGVDGGNSSTTLKYSAIDDEPYNGTSFYRLKQTDFNGQSETFSMVAVNGCGEEAITAFSNGDKITIIIDSKEDNNYNVILYDALGRILFNEKEFFAAGSIKKSYTINSGNGIFLLKVIGDKNILNQKLVIQK